MPIAGAPRTASVRIASATAAADCTAELDLLIRKPALVEQDDRAGFQTEDPVGA